VVFVANEFTAAVAVDSEVIAVAVVVVVFIAVAVVLADKFSVEGKIFPLQVVGAPGVETDGGGVLRC